MAVTLQGKGLVFGTPASYTAYDTNNNSLGAGYISPATEGVSVTHNADVERIQDSDGDYCGIILTGEYVECTFDLRPEGTSVANAKLAATIIPIGGTVAITGMPIIAVGEFSDVFNTDSGETNKWVYEGGASLRGTNTGKYMVTLPLRRYGGIAPAAAL